MDRISDIFRAKKPLIVFTTAGYPDMASSEAGIDLAVENGADIIELGVPFSDPMADGPVIAAASQQTAARGVGLADVLALAGRLRAKHPETGLILFSYLNPLLRFGYDRVCGELARLDADGVLPVDLPLEEREELLGPCRAHGRHLIPLVSPLTPPERIAAITGGMTGFVYAINVAGVTGARRGLPPDFPERIRQIKALTPLPVAAGFGIADAESAAEAARHADGVIAGSGFVKALETGAEAAAAFVRELAAGMRRASEG